MYDIAWALQKAPRVAPLAFAPHTPGTVKPRGKAALRESVCQIIANSRDPQEMALSILAEVLERIETRTV